MQWAPPSEQEHHGIIVKYTVSISGFPNGEAVSLTDTSETSVAVSGLEPYRKYLVGVKAATVVGGGPFGEFVQVSTPEDGKCMMLV